MPSVSEAVVNPAIAPNGIGILGEEPLPDVAVDDELDADDEESLIVRTKRFTMKPMHVEEAIDQMELVGHAFFLFHNADEDGLNVVYRRRDGSYGLLAPD